MTYVRAIIAFLLLAIAYPAVAQWQTPNHSVPIGQGSGVTGFNSAAPGNSGWVLTSNGASSDPTFQPSAGGAGSSVPYAQGRLSPLSGVAVPATSQAGVTQLFYVAYQGNNVPVWNGTTDVIKKICPDGTVGTCQLSLTLGSSWAATSNFDAFIIDNTGTSTLCTGPAWTSRTTQLTPLNGRNTNTGTFSCQINNTTSVSVPANQATFVGSIRTGLAGQINVIFGGSAAGGTKADIGIWNATNRVIGQAIVQDIQTNIGYASATPRPAMNSANNSVSFISGLAEDGFTAQYDNVIQLTGAAGANFSIGLVLDSISTFDKRKNALSSAVIFFPITCRFSWLPVSGYHTVTAMEAGDGVNTNATSGNLFEVLTAEFSW